MADQSDPEAMVREFCIMSGATPERATQYLEANGWDMVAASNSFFQDEDETSLERQTQEEPEAPEEPYTGPRTLDGRPAPQASTQGARKPATQQKKKGVATLGSLGGSSHHHDDDDDDDDDDYDDDEDDDNGRGNLFAGGEKSGLAVQDPQKDGGPKKIIHDILAKARANASNPDAASEAGPSRQTHFRGTGMTLGGEGVDSQSIPDPEGPRRSSSGATQERVLHIWQDGFSIDDGELRRFDDPANQMDLQMIRSGRAPLHLMNVQHDQPVDVKLHQHGTPYTPQPRTYKPFSGSGRRLGSPVPGDASETIGSLASVAATSAAAARPEDSASSSAPASGADSSQPTVMVRIQLPDGTRLPARFNLSQPLGDVFAFINGSSSDTRARPWVLLTTFPNKEHTDKDLLLGDIPELKKGGTAVVKWA